MIRGVAFICVGNSARSQIAEAIAKKIAKEKGLNIKVYSAGIQPSGFINSMAIRILEEDNIPIEDQYSKGMDQIPINDIDLVIFVCEESYCPSTDEVFKGKKILHWYLPDPFSYEQFYFIRESLKSRINDLFERLDAKDIQI
ncbi:MAG: arsenate reductase ArsC [bacterium]